MALYSSIDIGLMYPIAVYARLISLLVYIGCTANGYSSIDMDLEFTVTGYTNTDI